jgi:hypothetical protein
VGTSPQSPRLGRTPTIGATIEQRRALWQQLESNEDATLERHTARSGSKSHGERERERERERETPSLYDVSRSDPQQARLELQKKSVAASERDQAARRSAWRERGGKGTRPEEAPLRRRGVCGTSISLVAHCTGRVPKEGQRALGRAPRNWGKNLTLIASLSLEEGLSQKNMGR